MAGFNGSGTFVRTYSWANDKTNGVNITASRFDTEDSGFATGLSTTICKDGQQTTTAVIPFALGISCTAGTVSAPMVASIGDLTTGVYSSGSGKIDITSTGVRVGGFTSTGLNNTVVGSTTPVAGSFTTLVGTTTTVTTLNKVTVTAPASSATLTIANGKTLTVSNSVTLAGGDASVLAIAAAKTLTVSNTMTLAGGDSTNMTFPNTTDTVVTLAASQTLTNKTLTAAALGSSTATTQSQGDNSTKVATTAYVDGKSASGTLTAGTALTVNPYVANVVTSPLAHGLGAAPALVRVKLICLSADQGYATNDEIIMGGTATTSSDCAYTVACDATNIYLSTGNNGNPRVTNKASGSNGNITAANWKIIVTPYKIN